MNDQNNWGRPGEVCDSPGIAGCEGVWRDGTDSPTTANPDGFIAGHNSCDLRRHLDSAPPETPIRDVVDRCRIWESHADPEINRTRNPTMDKLYPTFTVGGTESNYDITKIGPKQANGCDPKNIGEHRDSDSGTGDSRDTRTVATDVEGVSTEEARTDI